MPPHIPPVAPPTAATPAVPLPARKPMLGSRRVPLFVRDVRIRLSPAAIELLWLGASVISEGESADGYYCGSTMVTLDLARASAKLSDPCDLAAAETLLHALRDNREIYRRAGLLARQQAEERADAALTDVTLDIRVSREGRHFHLDIDIEGRPRSRHD